MNLFDVSLIKELSLTTYSSEVFCNFTSHCLPDNQTLTLKISKEAKKQNTPNHQQLLSSFTQPPETRTAAADLAKLRRVFPCARARGKFSYTLRKLLPHSSSASPWNLFKFKRYRWRNLRNHGTHYKAVAAKDSLHGSGNSAKTISFRKR